MNLNKKNLLSRLQNNPLVQGHFKTTTPKIGLFHNIQVKFEIIPSQLHNEKDKQELITISYGFHLTPFGPCFIALTEKGILELRFIEDDENTWVEMVREKYQKAEVIMNETRTKDIIHRIFSKDKTNSTKPLYALLHGTDFQIKVWSALLYIPSGYITSYENIAQFIGNPLASRAVGNAIAKNNIAYVIPCHRVIKKTGDIGNYRWGIYRKKIILAKELALE